MSLYVKGGSRLDDAWVNALSTVNENGGTVTNLMLVIDRPGLGDAPEARAAVDEMLTLAGRAATRTVANTLFPADLYNPPTFAWNKSLSQEQLAELDGAADSLYSAYAQILPALKRFDGNRSGTYFSRLISWPGKDVGGVNQLALRVKYMRGRKNFHAGDFAIGGEGEVPIEDNIAFGLQEYGASDRRLRAFPCLVHVNLTVEGGVLSMTAIYRNWFLISRGYGNLIGLRDILGFLGQQCGLEIGELIVHAGHATVERSSYGGHAAVTQLAQRVRDAATAASTIRHAA